MTDIESLHNPEQIVMDGHLKFRRVFDEDFIKGNKYRIEEYSNFLSKVYIAIFDGYVESYYASYTTKWINTTYLIKDNLSPYIETGRNEVLVFNQFIKKRTFFELVHTAQESMEKRALNLILKKIVDESFILN